MYLQDLTFIEDGNPDMIGPRINMFKRQLVYNIVSQVQRFQQVPYIFLPVDKIIKFLDELPVMDDEAIYQLSLKCEPRNAQRTSLK